MLQTVSYEKGIVSIVDQQKLPAELCFIKLDTVDKVAKSIVEMDVRGASAIGITAAYGLLVGMEQSKAKTTGDLLKDLRNAKKYLEETRPTATYLFFALNNVMGFAETQAGLPIDTFKTELTNFTLKLAKGSADEGHRLAKSGAEVIFEGANIETHCNCGGLCAIELATIVGSFYYAKQAGKNFHVYTDETRPRFQGARLNVWELAHYNIPYTLIPDNHSGYLMQLGKIDMVFVGADSIAANGDVAAKVGDYGLAVLAKHHRIPYYVFGRFPSIDWSYKSGKDIPIEQRDPDEVRIINGQLITLPDANVLNYCFDVTPQELITAFITEEGIITPPFEEKFREIYERKKKAGDII